MRASKLARWRWLSIIAVLAIVAAACQQGGGTTTAGTDEPTATTGLDGGVTTTAGATPETPVGGELATYRMGTFSDTTTDNFWAYTDPSTTVWNAYLLADTKSALYQLNFPGIELGADLAASSDVPLGAAEGDGWAIEVPMREDATWSDGSPITANDIVFTFTTVRDLALGGNWLSVYPLPDPEAPDAIGLTDVQAVDDYTVKFVFNHQARARNLAPWGRIGSSHAGSRLGIRGRGGCCLRRSGCRSLRRFWLGERPVQRGDGLRRAPGRRLFPQHCQP